MLLRQPSDMTVLAVEFQFVAVSVSLDLIDA